MVDFLNRSGGLAMALLASVSLGVNSDAMEIVSNGHPKAVLVVPSQPSPVVRYAAKELQEHIQLATGVKLPIRKEDMESSSNIENPIYIGPCVALKTLESNSESLEALPANSFVIHSSGKALFLAGKDDIGGENLPLDDEFSMGTLFAVYDWLDRSLGVRWFWPGRLGTEVPKTANINCPESPSRKVVPQLISSRIRFTGNMGHHATKIFQERSILENNQWFRRQHLSKPVNPMYSHGFDDYWSRFSKTHPDYFALRPDGVRAPLDDRHNLVQMCVSNPDLPKQAVADWLQRRTPIRPYINACENDRRAIEPSCRCAECVALDVQSAKVSTIPNPWHIESRTPEMIPDWEYVSLTDRYAKFSLRILEEGKKHEAKAQVVMMAYSFYTDPPRETKLNKDVIVLVVPPYIYPHPNGKTDRFKNLWDEWASTGATLAYRPNHILVGYCLPYIYARQYGDDFKHAYDKGMIATMYDSLTGMWGIQGPNLYMHGRLHARPDLEVEAVLDEYFSAFGKAAPRIREYFDYWEKISMRIDADFQARINGGWAILGVAGHQIYTPETFVEGQRLLGEAKKLAKNDDPVVQERVVYLETWLEHARLATVVSSLHDRLKQDPNDAKMKATLIAAREQLDRFFAEHQESFIGADVASLRQVESWRSWK